MPFNQIIQKPAAKPAASRFGSDLPDEGFPLNEQGNLIMPDAVMDEGDRIRAALANRTYGTGVTPEQLKNTPSPEVTIAPNTRLTDTFHPTFWEQDAWNKNDSQLRNDLQLDSLRTLAARRRLDLENETVAAPLRQRLLEARIGASGAHDRFLEHQDAQTLEHTQGFFQDLMAEGAPGPHDPGYDQHVIGSLLRNPRFANTAGGREILKRISTERGVHTTLNDLRAQVQPGEQISEVRVGPNGPGITIKPVDANPNSDLKKRYGLNEGDILNPGAIKVGTIDRSGKFTGDDRGDFVSVTRPDGNKVTMSVGEFQRYHGRFSPETLQARTTSPSATPGATPTKFKYNPATGELE